MQNKASLKLIVASFKKRQKPDSPGVHQQENQETPVVYSCSGIQLNNNKGDENLLVYETTGKNLNNIMVSERTIPKSTHCRIPLI